MSLARLPLLVALALQAGPALAQGPAPAVPVPPIGTAPGPSAPIGAGPAPAAVPSPLAQAQSAPPSGIPAAPPGSVPGAQAARPAPSPAPAAAGVIPAAIAAIAGGEARVVRTAGEGEVEIPRAEYRARLVACLAQTSRCRPHGLTSADRDYLRYEMRGQRYSVALLDDIAGARMQQFQPVEAPSVIVPREDPAERGGPVPRLVEIENRGDADGYAMAVTMPHADVRATAPLGRSRRGVRSAGSRNVPDWW